MSKILSGDKLFFAPSQFADDELAVLTALAEELGAVVVPSPDSETILITQPLSSSYSAPDGSSAPYHWLGACASAKERINPNELDLPFFLTAPSDPEEDPRPLKFWVSVNVKRDRAEPADSAKAAVIDKLRRHGGIIVEKRAPADILVVNKESDFYRTVVQEIRKHKRHWQQVAEKDWVDACVKHGQLLSQTDVEAGLKRPRSSSIDSLESEEEPKVRRGPGRPPGKPRNEYSPNEDDFLCRFLAAYYPHGSHGSRKTYDDLVARQDAEPFLTARNHTSQSWHERYKKNSAPFSRRVQSFRQQGIGLDLKTPVEREREAETKRRLAELKSSQGGSSSSQQVSPMAARRSLVDLADDDGDERGDITPQAKRPKPALALGRAGRAAAAGVTAPSFKTLPGPSRKSTTPEAPRKSTSPARPPQPLPEASRTATSDSRPGPEAPPAPSGGMEAGPPVPLPESTTPPSEDPDLKSVAPAPAPETASVAARSRPSTPSATPGRAPAQPGRIAENRPDAAQEEDQAEDKDNGQLGPSSSQGGSEAVRSTLSQPQSAVGPSPTVRRARRSEVEVIVPRLSRSPRPSATGARDTPRPSTPSASASASASTSAAARGASHRSTPPRSSSPADSGSGYKTAQEHLTPAQQVQHGARLVAGARDVFKAHIAAYSEKYGCAPTELFAIVNSLGTKGAGRGGSMYWEDVERGLKDRFGY